MEVILQYFIGKNDELYVISFMKPSDQMTRRRECYNHFGEYRRTQVISNSPEFAKKTQKRVVM